MAKLTIRELNAMWYYRLTKVVFLVVCGASVLLITLNLVFAPRDYDNNKSYFKCHSGLTRTFAEVSLDANEPFHWTYDSEKFYCATDSELGAATKEVYPAYDYLDNENLGARVRTAELTSINKSLIAGKLGTNYTDYLSKRSIFRNILHAIAAVFAFLLIAEVVRRAFYYVVCGAIRPLKE